jgi:hypothetical protein
MIKKIITFILCLVLSGCSGFTIGSGLQFKFKNKIESKFVELNNGTFATFEEPVGNCGSSVTFFGVMLPIIPVWFNLNSCEKTFSINFTGGGFGDSKIEENVNIKLKYDGIIYNPISTKKLVMFYGKNGEYKSEYGQKFKFKINDFRKFRMSNDKVIIIRGKTANGKYFVDEIPVKWGFIIYNKWAIPGV